MKITTKKFHNNDYKSETQFMPTPINCITEI